MPLMETIEEIAKAIGLGFLFADDVAKNSHDTQMQQSGADQQKAASLDAAVQTAQAQTVAIVNAPKTVDGTVDALERGDF